MWVLLGSDESLWCRLGPCHWMNGLCGYECALLAFCYWYSMTHARVQLCTFCDNHHNPRQNRSRCGIPKVNWQNDENFVSNFLSNKSSTFIRRDCV